MGDLVEGVGVYPGQEEDLVITDVHEQYRVLSEMLLMRLCIPGGRIIGRILLRSSFQACGIG